MKGRLALCILSIMLLSLTAVQAADPMPVVLERVEINDIPVIPGSDNPINLRRDKEFDILVKLSAIGEDLDNVEVEASIAGYEFNDIRSEQLTDRSTIENLDEGVSYTRKLHITLPDDIDTGSYLLEIRVANREFIPLSQVYTLRLSAKTNEELSIEDVRFLPFAQANAGEAVLARVRVENLGQHDEEDVRVSLTFPELGMKDFSYINEIKEDEEEDSEELYVKLPRCVDSGVYNARVTVEWNDGRDFTTQDTAYQIVQNPDCEKNTPAVEVVVEPTQAPSVVEVTSGKQVARKVLETVLVVLIVLLVIVGLILGVSKLSQ